VALPLAPRRDVIGAHGSTEARLLGLSDGIQQH
jgi:hypothetical protein